ncbi:Major facilitator superfamily domain-containing protein 10 [Penicillium frequentans]|nr:Major facilitator superfamily domain-containing protein 10 [Penicillium glabrum]
MAVNGILHLLYLHSPAFPSLLSFYRAQDLSPNSLLNRILHYLNAYKTSFTRPIESHYDIVLLGGAFGSLFSSFKLWLYLYLTICSTVTVIFAYFRTFLASRAVGGLNEANTQLANIIVADITDGASRGASMALIKTCFSIAFTLGPMLGAALTSLGIVNADPFVTGSLHYSSSSYVRSYILETVYLWARLPETHPRLTLMKQVD